MICQRHLSLKGRNRRQGLARDERGGWHWPAFLIGPIWYFSKGMTIKGIWLSVICLITLFLAVPFIALYCGARGKSDYYEYRLRQKTVFDLTKI